MEENKKKGPGDIRLLQWPGNVLTNPDYMLGLLLQTIRKTL